MKERGSAEKSTIRFATNGPLLFPLFLTVLPVIVLDPSNERSPV